MTPPHRKARAGRSNYRTGGPQRPGKPPSSQRASIPFREGFRYPAEVQRVLPALADLKVIPVNWADLTPKDREEAKAHFRKSFGVD